ncbi:MAG: hypothetical protein HYY24_09045 [Verrucomicrobia bacterium]|nr:hypothetical protein [Verrucomicrobiota bacterium]
MKNEALIRDPVFQLNLLVWMAKPQPADGYRVRPFFVERGFQLMYIQQPFPLPQETQRAIAGVNLGISAAPEPELLLQRTGDKKALYAEAKANSFSPDSTTAKQARGHLLACGPAFGEVMQPLEQALLCYLVPADKCPAMSACLAALVAELRELCLKPGEFSTNGLAISGTDLVYSVDDRFKQFTGAAEGSLAILQNLEADTDPSPLLLVYSEDDSPDDQHRNFYRHALLQKLVATLVCDANLLPVGQTHSTTPRELAIKTTDEIFQYLARARQAGMERFIRKNIFGRVFSFWKDKPFSPVKLDHQRLQISYKDNLAKEQFLEWLEDARRTNFSDEQVDEKQMLLFDEETSGASPNPPTTA